MVVEGLNRTTKRENDLKKEKSSNVLGLWTARSQYTTRLITIDSRIQSAQKKKKLNRSIDSQNKRTHNRT